MEVTKAQLISGLTRFVRTEVLNKITDRPFKMMISAGLTALELRPEIADAYLENPMLKSKNGMYDVDFISEIAMRTTDDYGDFPLVIPGIPLVSPEEKVLRFTSEDIRKLKDYITGGNYERFN